MAVNLIYRLILKIFSWLAFFARSSAAEDAEILVFAARDRGTTSPGRPSQADLE
ncbi:MAG: hypothetical protein ACRDOH_20835 [Streptosporangiaceae bacterium]